MKQFFCGIVLLGIVACSQAITVVDVVSGQVRGDKLFSPAEAKYPPFLVGGHVAGIAGQAASLRVVIHRPQGMLQLVLPSEAAQVRQVYKWQNSIVVLSALDGVGSTAVSVFDADAGQMQDHFWAYGVVPSPDRRYLAFRRWVQARGALLMDSQYRIYDLQLSPTQNRRGEPARDATDDVGLFIYPLAPAELQREPHELTPGTVHDSLSEWAWGADSGTVAVLDRQGREASVVLAEMRGDRRPRVRVTAVPEMKGLCTAIDEGRSCRRVDHAVLAVMGHEVRINVPARAGSPASVVNLPASRFRLLLD
jgi:hypothetical protein